MTWLHGTRAAGSFPARRVAHETRRSTGPRQLPAGCAPAPTRLSGCQNTSLPTAAAFLTNPIGGIE